MNEDGAVLILDHLSAKSRVGSDLIDVSIRIESGEIHAILGDNDSGKDSFVDLLSGGNPWLSGNLIFANKPLRNLSRAKAIELGIQTIHMTPQSIATLSIFDNIYPKIRLKKGRFADDVPTMKELAQRKLSLFGTELDLDAPISSCTDNEKLIVSIVRSLCSPCTLLIVDEVTWRLSPAHVDALRAELSVYRERGTTILFLTNNVREVHNFADRVSFFEGGHVTDTQDVSNLDRFDLVRLSYAHLYQRKELETTSFELFFLKSYYESVLQSLPMPLLVINREGRITFVNKLFSLYHNVRSDSVIDQNLCDILSDGSDRRFDIREIPENEKREVMKLDGMSMNLNNESIPSMIYLAPVADAGDSPMGHLALFVDNPESQLRIEKYREMLRENKRIPYFAHEIRNPLGIIGNFLNLLRSQEMSDESREYFLWIEAEVKRIDHLVSDLIAESNDRRKSAGTKTIGLREFIDNILSTVVSPVRGRSIQFENEIAEGFSLDCDASGLREVVLNLVINAVEAMPNGGKLRVVSEILSIAGEKHVAIHVADDGIGIEEAFKEEIFNPFVSTKKGNEKRGLGLSICKDIIETMGGSISVDSSPGTGSIFSIRFPIRKDDSENIERNFT